MNFLRKLFGKKQTDGDPGRSIDNSSITTPSSSDQLSTSSSQNTQNGEDVDPSSVNEAIEFWGTRLHRAAYDGDVEYAQKLISLGATVDSHDEHGNTPLCRAAEGGHAEMCKMLVQNGANIKVQAEIYTTHRITYTPLVLAVEHECKSTTEELQRKSVVEYFISLGASPNEKMEPGNESALHRASWWGSLEIVKLLVIKGAEVNTRNWAKKTPLGYALEKVLWRNQTPAQIRSFKSIAKFLKAHGGKE